MGKYKLIKFKFDATNPNKPITSIVNPLLPKIIDDEEDVPVYIIQEILNDYGLEKINEMMSICPVQTGRLRDSFQMVAYDNYLVVENSAPYAGFVDRGTVNMDARNFTEPLYSGVPELENEIYLRTGKEARVQVFGEIELPKGIQIMVFI